MSDDIVEQLEHWDGTNTISGTVILTHRAAAEITRLRSLTASQATDEVVEVLELCRGHLEEVLTDPKWHPIGRCPVLDRVKALIASLKTGDRHAG